MQNRVLGIKSDTLRASCILKQSGQYRPHREDDIEQRVKEAARLGFTKAIVPYKNIEKRKIDSTIEIIPIHSIYEAIKVLKTQDSE